VESFLAAAASALRVGGHSLDVAESSYTRDFLEEDTYEDWSQPLREEARTMYLAVLRAKAEVERDRGVDAAVGAQLRILEVDPWDEVAHLSIISALQEAGRHGEARRARARYLARMKELGIARDPP
jgi:DNA-binding SARP family transcriptional activator